MLVIRGRLAIGGRGGFAPVASRDTVVPQSCVQPLNQTGARDEVGETGRVEPACGRMPGPDDDH